MIVVDANILAFYVIEGVHTKDAHDLRARDPEWLVPPLWSVEFQSILWKYVRFGGMPAEKAMVLLEQAESLFSANEAAPPPDRVLRDALAWSITVYDAQYVSLARQQGIPCVTEDAALIEACPGIAVSLKHFIGRSRGGTVREKHAAYSARRKSRSKS